MKAFREITSFIFIVLLPIQDFLLANTGLGFFGSNASMILVPVMAVLVIVKGSLPFKYSSLIVSFLLLAYSFGIYLYFSLGAQQLEALNGMKLILMIIFSITVIVFYKTFEIENLEVSLVCSTALLFLGVFLCDVLSLELVGLLHTSPSYDARIRGFSVESSLLGATAMFLLLSIYSLKDIKQGRENKFYLLFILFVIALTGSKGAVLTFIISYFIVELIRGKYGLKQLGFAILIIPFIMLVGSGIFQDLLVDIESYNSVGTRLGLLISALKIASSYPFGVGFWGYYVVAPEYIRQVADSLPLNVTELYSIANGYNYSFKSALADFLVLFGAVPTFLISIFLWITIYKGKNSFYLTLLLVSSFILLSVSIPIIGYYFTLLPIIIYSQISRSSR